REIHHPHVDSIVSQPVFQQTFGQRPYQFAYVDVRQLVALQAWVEPRADSIPTREDDLLAFALPLNWDVPAEVSFIQPSGPIQILTSSPSLQGLHLEFDALTGTVKLGAAKHLNLIQVTHWNGRHYLRNGYHRVVDAIGAGIFELPALVNQAV